MKLNIKDTIKVGFAFFTICMFWQLYDTLLPLIMTNTFGLSDIVRGFLMGLDNILALFLLPLFGSISDRSNSKRGRRTPFFVIGVILSAVLLITISVVDQQGLINLKKQGVLDNAELYRKEYVTDSQILEYLNNDKHTEEAGFIVQYGIEDGKVPADFDAKEEPGKFYELIPIKVEGKTSTAYLDLVIPAREALAYETTQNDPTLLIAFVAVLFLVLVAMATYRSPAVALMPDVTPKPLRSQANAIINIMGGLGSGVAMIIMFLRKDYSSNILIFALTAGAMLASMIYFRRAVDEPALVEKKKRIVAAYDAAHGTDIENELDEEEALSGTDKLSPAKRKSLILILFSIFLWFLGYNAMTSTLSIYAANNLGFTDATLIYLTMIPSIFSAVMFLPAAILAAKIGRRRSILLGIVILISGLIACYTLVTPATKERLYYLLAFVTAGWATININSYPMIVEMSKGSNVGKYTGYYYTFSMAAQGVAPMFLGVFMNLFGSRHIMFIYAAVFVFFSGITMFFVKHGDSVIVKKGEVALEAVPQKSAGSASSDLDWFK